MFIFIHIKAMASNGTCEYAIVSYFWTCCGIAYCCRHACLYNAYATNVLYIHIRLDVHVYVCIYL